MIELMKKVVHGKTNHKKEKHVKLSYEAQKLQFPNCLLGAIFILRKGKGVGGWYS